MESEGSNSSGKTDRCSGVVVRYIGAVVCILVAVIICTYNLIPAFHVYSMNSYVLTYRGLYGRIVPRNVTNLPSGIYRSISLELHPCILLKLLVVMYHSYAAILLDVHVP